MIVSFRSPETERVWHGLFSRKLPQDVQASALRKLRILNNAKLLKDLAVPPNNGSRRSAGIEEGSTPFASMISGGSASAGLTEARPMSRSSTTTSEIPNPMPGEILQLEFLEPMGLSQTALARAIKVPPRRINEIVLGKRAITADTDLRLER